MIHAAILHHPKRQIHPKLERWMLEPGDGPVRSVRTVTEGSNVWEAQRIALESLKDCPGHALIMHDDMIPCYDFSRALEYFQNTFPERVISLWHNWDRPDGELHPFLFTPGGAYLLPCALIRSYLAWQAQHVRPEWPMDDTRLACWCAATNRSIWVPFPNLVDHAPVSSMARPGQPSLLSPSFDGDWWHVHRIGEEPTQRQRRQILISRNMHFVPPYDSGAYWTDAPLG